MRFTTIASAFLLLAALLVGCGYWKATDKKIYRIGRDSTWYPLLMLGKEKNMVAFSNELMRAVAKEGGFHFEILETSYRTQFQRLNDRHVDGILSTVSPQALVRGKYIYSSPFFRTGPVIVTPINSSISSLDELKGKVVGILYSTDFIFDDEDYPSIIFTPYENITEALDQLENNRVDALILPLVPAYIYTKRFYGNTLKIASTPLNEQGVRLVTLDDSNGNRLLEHFNEGLETVRDSNLFQDLVDKWTIVDPRGAIPS